MGFALAWSKTEGQDGGQSRLCFVMCGWSVVSCPVRSFVCLFGARTDGGQSRLRSWEAVGGAHHLWGGSLLAWPPQRTTPRLTEQPPSGLLLCTLDGGEKTGVQRGPISEPCVPSLDSAGLWASLPHLSPSLCSLCRPVYLSPRVRIPQCIQSTKRALSRRSTVGSRSSLPCMDSQRTSSPPPLQALTQRPQLWRCCFGAHVAGRR